MILLCYIRRNAVLLFYMVMLYLIRYCFGIMNCDVIIIKVRLCKSYGKCCFYVTNLNYNFMLKGKITCEL